MRDRDQAEAVIRDLLAAALAAADPRDAVRRVLRLEDGELSIGDAKIASPGGIHLVAVGKAAVSMAQGALDALNGAIASGNVITKDGHVSSGLPDRLSVFEAGHPIPDARGVEATRQMLADLERLGPDAVVLALISGGGSALLEAPKEGISLEDFGHVTDLMLRAGAPIEHLNSVRSPLSRVKAGGLRRAAASVPWVTLVLSDVLGNDPRIIASGPTVHGTSDPAAALALLDAYGLRERAPASILAALNQAAEQEDATNARDVLAIVGDNALAIAAACERARELGLTSQVSWEAVTGEARRLGQAFVTGLEQVPPDIDIVLGGGEATVTVQGDGRGGRNTEFALAAALALEGVGIGEWVVASLATDGQDALTGLAGAIADAGTAARARERGIDPELALLQNDSMHVFEVAGGAVATGPTGTNVNDLYIAVRVADTPGDVRNAAGGT